MPRPGHTIPGLGPDITISRVSTGSSVNPTNSESYQCKDCSKSYESERSLLRHKAIEHDTRLSVTKTRKRKAELKEDIEVALKKPAALRIRERNELSDLVDKIPCYYLKYEISRAINLKTCVYPLLLKTDKIKTKSGSYKILRDAVNHQKTDIIIPRYIGMY